jgi:hypothetical protein
VSLSVKQSFQTLTTIDEKNKKNTGFHIIDTSAYCDVKNRIDVRESDRDACSGRGDPDIRWLATLIKIQRFGIDLLLSQLFCPLFRSSKSLEAADQ